MARLVRFRILDGVAVITLDAPPVNALSAALRAGLWEAFTRIDTNPDVKAAVLMSAGGMFSAGADIGELSEPPKDPSLSQLCSRIEACSKPVIVAIHGLALGGGAELMFAAHYRLAAGDAGIGLPEVTLGLVPCAGGTQRLPRLIGPELTLQLMMSAKPIDVSLAHRIGLVDGIVQGDLGSGAIAFAQNLIENGKGPRRTCDITKHFSAGRAYAAGVAKGRDALAGSPLHAPQRVVDCVEAASLLPFEAGLAFEEDAFARCLAHPQSRAFRHVFAAERTIDAALIERDGKMFKPVVPMGKACVARLRKALRGAADYLVTQGVREDEIDSAMVAYGFRKGPFGGQPDAIENENIARRLICAIMVEGAACVDQGAVQRPSDIDALAVHGMGFPRRKGGPMRAAQSDGLIAIRKDLRIWSEDSDLWSVPELLDQAIKNASGFDALG
ncbi:MAG: enoyl-CoA hydratase-related protein [Octadecabacter sp.]